MPRRRLLAWLSTAVLATVPVAALGAPAAHAAAPAYVALGDSYSSGVGTRSYLSDGTTCQRSAYAFPSLIAASRSYALNLRACSGATVADVTGAQLSALSTGTAYVTVSVGGNDIGFTDVLTTCAQPAWASNCNGAIDGAQAYVRNTLPGSVRTLYAAIRAKAPGAKVVVVGYPRIFDGEDCNAFTWFSPTEQTRLNQTADLLDATLTSAASAAGFTVANPTAAFTGHAVCDSPEWVNGLSSPTSDSYHPNRAGHASGYTPLVGPRLTGATVSATSATLSTARAAAPQLADTQRTYAARDAGIRPERFVRPDLHSPRVLRAAARAGVDVEDRASVDRADRAAARRQAREWAVSR